MVRSSFYSVAPILVLTLSAPSWAAVVVPTSYNMPNGYGQASGGSFNYWDRSYSGSGNTQVDGALLSGGLGDLTNGVIASGNWFDVENVAGTGPYVGWINTNPTIIFNFASVIDFLLVRIHFDDADGQGGVMAPSSVTINSAVFPLADPPGSAPFFAEFNVAPLASTNQLTITLNRRDLWVFASEFQFSTEQTNVVPEPSSLMLMSLASALAVACQRRRRK